MRSIYRLDRVDDDTVIAVGLCGSEDVFEVVGLVDTKSPSPQPSPNRFARRRSAFRLRDPVFSLSDLADIFFTRKVGYLHRIVDHHLLDDLEHDGGFADTWLPSQEIESSFFDPLGKHSFQLWMLECVSHRCSSSTHFESYSSIILTD